MCTNKQQEALAGKLLLSLMRSNTFLGAQVVVVPGRLFHVRGKDTSFKCPWVRIAYCNVTHAALQEGARRLGCVLRAHAAQTGYSGASNNGHVPDAAGTGDAEGNAGAVNGGTCNGQSALPGGELAVGAPGLGL